MKGMIEVEGLKSHEADEGSRRSPEVQVIMAEATLPLLEVVASYPGQPPPKNEIRVPARAGHQVRADGQVYQPAVRQDGAPIHAA